MNWNLQGTQNKVKANVFVFFLSCSTAVVQVVTRFSEHRLRTACVIFSNMLLHLNHTTRVQRTKEEQNKTNFLGP